MTDTLLTTDQLAERWQCHPGTLRAWRLAKPRKGPPYVKHGRRFVRYRMEDVLAFEREKSAPVAA